MRMTFIGCVAPIQRIGVDSRTHSPACATSTARCGEHSAVRSHSWRPSQNWTAWRASKPAWASSLVCVSQPRRQVSEGLGMEGKGEERRGQEAEQRGCVTAR